MRITADPAAGHVATLPLHELARPDFSARWDALAQCASEPNPFYESWYLLPSLTALGPAAGTQVLRFEIDGELAGILPVTRPRRYYRWPIPHLAGWAHPNCFLGAPLVAAGLECAFWRALLAWADQSGGLALFLHLPQIPLEGRLYAALNEVLAEQDRPAALVHREDRALLRGGSDPEAYLEAALSGKKRKELRRQHARLSELGAVDFQHQRGADGLDGWIEDFLKLEAAGWKGAAGSALASSPATTALFRDALLGAARRDRLERLALTLDERPLAMLANFITAPGAFSYKTAFAEDYARFSPGVLLQRENLSLLTRPEIAWCDSCAAADHPMIDHIWRDRRALGRISIAIGGGLRRRLFRQLARAELARTPTGLNL